MNRISLSGSMRSNLLSLQNTAKLQSATQERMATGKKVNSAIDNPSSYYTASALSNRSKDLGALLDSMSQSAQTLKAVVQTLESGSKFLEQASALTMQTLENVTMVKPTPPPDDPIAAYVSTEAELLDAINNTTAADGVIVLEGDITLSKNVGLVLKTGQKLVGKGFIEGTAETAKLTFNFDSNTQAIGIDLAENSELSNLVIDYTSVNKTNDNDFHAVRNNGYTGVKLTNLDITIQNDDSGSSIISGIHNAGRGEITLEGKINIFAPSAVSSRVHGISSNGIDAKLIQTSNSVLNITTIGKVGHGIFYGNNMLSGKVNISVGGISSNGTYNADNILSGNVNITTFGQFGSALSGGTNILSGIVNIKTNNESGHAINSNNNTFKSDLKLLVQTNYSNAGLIFNSGAIKTNTWEAGVQIGYKNSDSSINFLWQAQANGTIRNGNNFNDLSQAPFNWNTLGAFPQAEFDAAFVPENVDVPEEDEEKLIPTNPDKLNSYAQQYNSILDQYNLLINDGGYKGVNLLKENSLRVNFNEDRSSKLEIKGVDASTQGLGLEKANWTTLSDINKSIKELTSAINQIRDYNSEFGNYHTIISNREDFTHNLINVLNEGADKLTLADMNEESANMLALQTRQQLAVNSLSLSSQASQSILKLF